MKYLLNNFFAVIRRYKVSSLLNVVGMSVAFAAFYVIMTQVDYDMNYNKSVPGTDNVYILSIQSQSYPDKYCPFVCRPIGEDIVNRCPGIECGGIFDIQPANNSVWYIKRQDGRVDKMYFDKCQFTAAGFKTFGFEAVEGSMDELSRPGTLALSHKFAKKNNISVGDRLSGDSHGEAKGLEVVAIFKDFPENSDLGDVRCVCDMRDRSIDDQSEWSYSFAIKFLPGVGVEDVRENSVKTMREYLLYANDLTEEDVAADEELAQQLDVLAAPHFVAFKDLFYNSSFDSTIGRTGNKATDMTLLAVAILIIVIAIINFINFFFALVPKRLKGVNTYKVFGVSRGSLILDFILEAVGPGHIHDLRIALQLVHEGIILLAVPRKFVRNLTGKQKLLVEAHVVIHHIPVLKLDENGADNQRDGKHELETDQGVAQSAARHASAERALEHHRRLEGCDIECRIDTAQHRRQKCNPYGHQCDIHIGRKSHRGTQHSRHARPSEQPCYQRGQCQ